MYLKSFNPVCTSPTVSVVSPWHGCVSTGGGESTCFCTCVLIVVTAPSPSFLSPVLSLSFLTSSTHRVFPALFWLLAGVGEHQLLHYIDGESSPTYIYTYIETTLHYGNHTVILSSLLCREMESFQRQRWQKIHCDVWLMWRNLDIKPAEGQWQIPLIQIRHLQASPKTPNISFTTDPIWEGYAAGIRMSRLKVDLKVSTVGTPIRLKIIISSVITFLDFCPYELPSSTVSYLKNL